jgi:hypothetical protein
VNGACRQKKNTICASASDHRETDALPPYRQQSDHDAHRRRRECSEQYCGFRWPAPYLRSMGAGIAGHPEKHRVAERQESAEADEEVECTREECETQRLHQEDRVHAEQGRQHQRHGHDDGRDQHDPRAGHAADVVAIAMAVSIFPCRTARRV